MTKIYTEIFGSGKPIVLVHGWAMHSGIWRAFAQELATHYKVTLVDLPGHGRSVAMSPFTLESVSKALVDAMPDEPCCWLGWSLGAAVVYWKLPAAFRGESISWFCWPERRVL